MEDFLAHPEKLLELLGAGRSDNQSLEATKTVSHQQQMSGYDFLANCEETLETLADALMLEFHGDQIKVRNVYSQIAQKNVFAI